MLKRWLQTQLTKLVNSKTWKKWLGSFLEIVAVVVLASLVLNTVWFLLYFAVFNQFYNYLNGILRWGIVLAILELSTLLWERWKVYDQYVTWYRRLKAAQSGESDDESGKSESSN